MNRRTFLKLSAMVGTAAAAGIGLERVGATSEPPASLPSFRHGQPVEARIDMATGKVEPNPAVLMRNSACLGCFSTCGNRVKIDRQSGQIMRVFGNPYNPNNTENPLPYETSVKDAFLAFSGYQDKGLAGRATVCARGNSTVQSHYDPMRVLVPLKRAGKRGDGKWQPISWEQALNETVEGGPLFQHLGETQVIEGFRQVRDLKTPLDPAAPEYGPKANQLVFIGGRGDGRTPFAPRFTGAFGSVNFYNHAAT